MEKDILYPLRWIHGQIVEGPDRLRRKHALKKKIRREFQNNRLCVFLVMTPEHGNLGDHAIAWAAREQMEKAGIHCLEITQQELYAMEREGDLSLMNGYPIAINGGGNIGTLWPDVEQMMETIVIKNPRSPIVILPNTAVFDSSPQGEETLKRACRIFGKHKNMRIYAREETTFSLLKDNFPNVKLVPDLVLSLKWDQPQKERRGCIFCLRSDCEKTRSESREASLRRQAAEIFSGHVRDLDMISPMERIPKEQHELHVRQHMTAFSAAELVITDRLHAMLLCALTGTPCIVLNSKSTKIAGCYRWIRELPYIRMDAGEELRKIKECLPRQNHFDGRMLDPYFQELREDMVKLAGGR